MIPTVLRPTLKDAFLSVFHQTFPGRVQVLIGIDRTARSMRVSAQSTGSTVLWSRRLRAGGGFPGQE